MLLIWWIILRRIKNNLNIFIVCWEQRKGTILASCIDEIVLIFIVDILYLNYLFNSTIHRFISVRWKVTSIRLQTWLTVILWPSDLVSLRNLLLVIEALFFIWTIILCIQRRNSLFFKWILWWRICESTIFNENLFFSVISVECIMRELYEYIVIKNWLVNHFMILDITIITTLSIQFHGLSGKIFSLDCQVLSFLLKLVLSVCNIIYIALNTRISYCNFSI